MTVRPERIDAPWTEEIVSALNDYQRSGMFHPFTCPAHLSGEHILVAKSAGWYCGDQSCSYHQTWAHAFMADRTTLAQHFRDAAQAKRSAAYLASQVQPERILHSVVTDQPLNSEGLLALPDSEKSREPAAMTSAEVERGARALYIEAACVIMHDAYEAAAVGAGWETNIKSRVLWPDVPFANQQTMRAAVGALVDWIEKGEL